MGEIHETKIREVLIKRLEDAKTSIHIAAAYFTDNEMVKIIKEKAKSGVNVEIIIYDHSVNSPTIIELNSEKVKTCFYDQEANQPIYPKFCIIDHEVLVTGNHAWAYAAAKTIHPEPLIVNNEHALIGEYFEKFNSLKKLTSNGKLVHFKTKPDPRNNL